MSVFKQRFLTVLLGTALLGSASLAQEFPGYQGGSARTGHHDAALQTNHPDKGYLRWWDPLFQLDTVIDNWMGSTVQNPLGSWNVPALGTVASFYEELGSLANPPYYYVAPVPSDSYDNYWTPQFGFSATTFSWIFNGLAAGEEYSVYVNVPIGATATNPNPLTPNEVYQTDYAVYEISGVVNVDNPGQPIYQKVNVNTVGGGWVRLGNNGLTTDLTFQVAAASTSITVKLINTIPRNAQGQLEDTRANIVVYADAAKIERGGSVNGTVVASPIVAELKDPAAVFPWRVMASRIEDFSAVDSNLLKSTGFGVLTSFRHNGRPVIAGDTLGRRNIVWSWPAYRPTALNNAEEARYAQEKLEFMQGIGKYPAASKRFDQAITVDNTNSSVAATAGWVVQNTPGGFKGVDYLNVAGVSGGTQSVVFSPKLSDANYAIDIWSQGGATYSDGVQVIIRAGALVLGTARVNMQTAGWVRLRVNTTFTWGHTFAAPLSVAITNDIVGSAGMVAADMVRFTRTSDMSMRSTPVYARLPVDTGAGVQVRDVVVVAMENGRIYCLDAEGTKVAGVPTGDTQIYWTYPSETAADPNQTLGLDGPDGMAEMPTGFDISSALIENVAGQDRLYIASTNGRVYCLDMQGRGDGTTTRIWSYPDDYPSPSVESRLGRITGSLAFEVTGAGPTLFVPAPQGRLYALDAAGNAGTKTTAVRWTFPDIAGNPIGAINMTPVVDFGKVFFGTGNGAFGNTSTLFALDVNDTNADNIGDIVWSKTTSGGATFLPFGTSSPATAPAADVDGVSDYLFIANNNFDVYAINANTGADIWRTPELASSPSASLGFTWMRVPDTTTALVNAPLVMVPTMDGRYSGLFARPADTDINGGRTGWEVTLYGQNNPPAVAFGAKDTTIPNPDDDENSWMYGADSAGFVYAWNYDPDYPDNGQGVTPGIPPIDRFPNPPNDNLSQRLNDLVLRAQGSLITPDAYRDLTERQRAGTLRYSDIQRYVNQITRQHYEFGETLYFVIYDLADPNFYSPVMPYTMDVTFNAPGASTQRRAFSAFPVLSPPNQERGYAALTQWSLLPVGGNALVPGRIGYTFRVLASERQGANRTIIGSRITPNGPALPGGTVQLANPLALAKVQNPVALADHIGYTLDASHAEASFNGNIISSSPITVKQVDQNFSPDSNSYGDEVSHGQDGVAPMYVFDRSLLTLVYGPDRGLQNLRVQLGDLWWPTGVTPAKIFTNPALAGLEDQPGSAGNNVSLDYPDIRRDRMNVTKTQFGAVENPIFQPVSLIPPTITSGDTTNYRTDYRVFNMFLNRTLMPTTFDFDVKVPQYQPPAGNSNYQGVQYVYVDAGNPGRNFQGSVPSEAFRQFNMHADIAVDERLSVGRPTIDLNIIPGGGGFSPIAPWIDPAFGLLNAMFQDPRNPFWARFIVYNEGNVNMLRMRLAKQIEQENTAAIEPVMFFAPGLSPRAWLDARWHLHSDLDPNFLPLLLGGNAVLQKPRPGDNEPTRFRVNPKVRRNPNLGVNDGDQFGVGAFINAQAYDESKLDPKVALSIPIGAPVGQYQQSVYPIEDRTDTAFDRQFPTLNIEAAGNVYEPFADPPMIVRFQVRETRMTNRNSIKTAPMVDNLGLTGTEPLTWQSSQPTATRTGSGALFVGFTSDRLDAGNVPSFLSRPKVGTDTEAASRSRIYIASLALGTGTPTSAYAAISDLSTFANSTANRWFNHALSAYPSQPPATLFGVPVAELDAATVSFQNPSFAGAGVFEPLSAIGANGKRERNSLYMAFTGTADRLTAAGERRRESRLFIAEMDVAANGTVNAGVPIPLAVNGDTIDPQARIGKPSVVQNGAQAVVFYPLSSGSGSQIVWSAFDGRQWVQLGGGRRAAYAETLRLGTAFEAAGNPSATLRPYQMGAFGRIELLFNARMRGRSQPEVYMARIGVDRNGRPAFNNAAESYTVPFGVKLDRLEQDPRTGLYWATGSEWQRRAADITPTAEVPTNPLSANFIDVKTFHTASGTWRSVLDYTSLKQEEGSPILTFNSTFGGKVYVDTAAGSVRFSGAMIPANSVLWVRANPRFVRVAGLDGMNYRAPQMQYDDRYIGDNSYWLTTANLGMPLGANARNDRFVISYGKTSGNTTERSRPYMKTLRFGIQLPSSIATNDVGAVTFLTAAGVNTPYQLEPSTGKVYFMAEMEDRQVTISYDGVDQHGRPLGRLNATLTVGLIEETPETPIPMNDVANESAVALTLDPSGGSYSTAGPNIPFNTLNPAWRRPGLIWMFWTSTRGGGSDIYFQTVAPRFGSTQAGN